MTTDLYIRLIVYVLFIHVMVFLIKALFSKIRNRFVRFILFLLELAGTLFLGLSLIAFDYTIIWRHEYPFAALYLVLVPDIFMDIVFFLFSLFQKDKEDKKTKAVLGLLICALFTLYNVINMQTITPDFHKISSSKLKHEYRVAFFADLHYGSSQSQKTVDDALDDIVRQEPDFLLLGGDITDENTSKEEMEYIYKKIGSLGIETYFIYGNHDRQERAIEKYGVQAYTEKELEEAITNNGITILYEDFIKINDDLVLLGREDPSHPDERKAVKDLPALPYGSYIVSIDHTPYQNDEIIELKADLQLSGHTHAAQFFPIQTVYKILGLNVCGDYYIGDTHLYVTPGISGWALPLRSEAHCHYEIFDLLPE